MGRAVSGKRAIESGRRLERLCHDEPRSCAKRRSGEASPPNVRGDITGFHGIHQDFLTPPWGLPSANLDKALLCPYNEAVTKNRTAFGAGCEPVSMQVSFPIGGRTKGQPVVGRVAKPASQSWQTRYQSGADGIVRMKEGTSVCMACPVRP